MQTGNESHRLGSRLSRVMWVQLFIAFALLMLATILGAFFAHTLEDKIDQEAMDVFRTGNRYHFYFSLAMVGGAILWQFAGERLFLTANWLLFAGILCFCGSLYFLSLREWLNAELSFLGPVTPLGGLLFIIGCGCFMTGCYRVLKR